MIAKAEAISHGAATIINAIATGKGAAVGVDLWTKATVILTDDVG
ncbi:MAG: shikimate kinase, partial [Candidatus Bathyarchaeota archaeon]